MALAVSLVAAPAQEAVLGYSVLVPHYVLLLALPRLVQSNRGAARPLDHCGTVFAPTVVSFRGFYVYRRTNKIRLANSVDRYILGTNGLESVFLLGNRLSPWSHLDRFCQRHGMVHAMGETTFVTCHTLLEENELVPSLQVSRVQVYTSCHTDACTSSVQHVCC